MIDPQCKGHRSSRDRVSDRPKRLEDHPETVLAYPTPPFFGGLLACSPSGALDLTDPLLVGQILQFGFQSKTSNFADSQNVYDNILVTLE
jgi:hypothetical protein